MATSILEPRWKPIAIPGECVPPGGTWFDPVLVRERGLLIVGGPLAIHLYAVLARQMLFLSIPAQHVITGFAVSSGTLYVQDGPVLSGWDLTTRTRFKSVDLNTHRPVGGGGAADGEVTFSAPVARQMQLDAQVVGRVFSLSSNGTINAFDDDLAHVVTHKYDAPLRPELALAEIEQDSGAVLCHLYYITPDGGIFAVDASHDMTQLTPCVGSGIPDPKKVLPLRFEDGLLWGGGLLGADLFAMLPDLRQPFRLTVAAPTPGGWRSYEVAPAEKLVLVSDGIHSRLVSYAEAAQTRDRWQLRTAPTASYSVFGWRAEAARKQPWLALEIEVAAAGSESAVDFRTLLVNTVDSTNPALTSDYPPPTETLSTGSFSPGSFAAELPRVAELRCRPVVAQNTLYMVVHTAAPGAGGGANVVAAFNLVTAAQAVMADATARLAELVRRAQPLQVFVTRWDYFKYSPKQPRDRVAVRDTYVGVILTPGSPLYVRTNGSAMLYLDSALAGRQIALDVQSLPLPNKWTGVRNAWTQTLPWGEVVEICLEFEYTV